MAEEVWTLQEILRQGLVFYSSSWCLIQSWHWVGVNSSWDNDIAISWKGWGGGVGVRMEWFKRFPHLECLCFHCVCVCVYVCADVNMCVCQSSVPTASEKRILWEAQGRGGGGVMATGRRQSTRLLCSLLLLLSRVQLFARGQWSETLRQGALTRLDPGIKLQRKHTERGEHD